MIKTDKMIQLVMAVVALGLAIYLSVSLLEKSSPQFCPTGVPCPQDCNKCPVA